MTRSRFRRRENKKATKGEHPWRIATIEDPAGSASEAYRSLRTNLLYSVVDRPPKTILITSYGPVEGKSTTCANLGVVMAQAGKAILIVDCDLRKPTLHRIFGLRNPRGTVNILAGECGLHEAVQEVPQGLKVLPVGAVPPNPAELLSSERFGEFMEQVRQEFDYVLLDAPPLAPVSDASILASHTDGVFMVLDAQKTRKNSLRRGVNSLKTVGANILGTVMNNVENSKEGYYSSRAYK